MPVKAAETEAQQSQWRPRGSLRVRWLAASWAVLAYAAAAALLPQCALAMRPEIKWAVRNSRGSHLHQSHTASRLYTALSKTGFSASTDTTLSSPPVPGLPAPARIQNTSGARLLPLAAADVEETWHVSGAGRADYGGPSLDGRYELSSALAPTSVNGWKPIYIRRNSSQLPLYLFFIADRKRWIIGPDPGQALGCVRGLGAEVGKITAWEKFSVGAWGVDHSINLISAEAARHLEDGAGDAGETSLLAVPTLSWQGAVKQESGAGGLTLPSVGARQGVVMERIVRQGVSSELSARRLCTARGRHGARVGCKGACSCTWWEHCYPQLDSDQPFEDEGACSMNMMVMALASLVIAVAMLALTLSCRMLLQHRDFILQAHNEASQRPFNYRESFLDTIAEKRAKMKSQLPRERWPTLPRAPSGFSSFFDESPSSAAPGRESGSASPGRSPRRSSSKRGASKGTASPVAGVDSGSDLAGRSPRGGSF